MRYALLLLMACFAAVGAESTNRPNSLEGFSKQVRESFERKDGKWLVGQFYTNGMPAEYWDVIRGGFRSYWGQGNLVVTSVETFPFADYKPIFAPGDYRGRKLRFTGKPTHWVVLKTGIPEPKSAGGRAPKAHVTNEFAVFQMDGRWRIAGSTYADAQRK